jgi:single-strand DNA-binding protein
MIAELGRLVEEPDLKESDFNGVKSHYLRNCLAVHTGQDETMFLNFTVWGRTAENIAKYLHHGSKLMIEGRLKPRNWTSKAGEKHQDYYVKVSDVTFADSGNKEEKSSDLPGLDSLADDLDDPTDDKDFAEAFGGIISDERHNNN